MHYWLKLKALVRAPLLVCLWVPCSPSFIAARSHGWVFPGTDQYVWVGCRLFAYFLRISGDVAVPVSCRWTAHSGSNDNHDGSQTKNTTACCPNGSTQFVIPTALPSILNLDCNGRASPSCVFALSIMWFRIPNAPGWGHHLYTVAVEEQGNIQMLGLPSSGSCPTRVSPRLGTCSWTDRS